MSRLSAVGNVALDGENKTGTYSGPNKERELAMTRSKAMDKLVEGFFRGGAWGAAVGLFIAVVEVAPALLR
jgi:hypothetical protein